MQSGYPSATGVKSIYASGRRGGQSACIVFRHGTARLEVAVWSPIAAKHKEMLQPGGSVLYLPLVLPTAADNTLLHPLRLPSIPHRHNNTFAAEIAANVSSKKRIAILEK